MRPRIVLASLAVLAGLAPASAQYAGSGEIGVGLNLRQPGPGIAGAPVTSGALSPAMEGRRMFMKLNCYGCHGIRGRGGMGPDLKGEADGVFIALHGSDEGMPAFQKYLAIADLDNLRAYLKTLGTTSEPTFTHWWEPIPTR